MSDPVAAPGTRSAARRRALDILFEADLLDRPVAEVLARHRDDREAGALDAYTVELVDGVAGLLPQLDARIADAAEHWTIERMPLVDRNLLRLAAYELVARPEVPTAVVLDEAIELAKLLSTADSGRFVNGVLAHVAAEVRGRPRRLLDIRCCRFGPCQPSIRPWLTAPPGIWPSPPGGSACRRCSGCSWWPCSAWPRSRR